MPNSVGGINIPVQVDLSQLKPGFDQARQQVGNFTKTLPTAGYGSGPSPVYSQGWNAGVGPGGPRAVFRGAQGPTGGGAGGMFAGVGGELQGVLASSGPTGQIMAGLMGAVGRMAVSPAGMAAGGIAVGAATFAAVQHFATSARDLNIESKRLNVSIGYYQQLGLAARRTGTDMGTLTAAMEHLAVESDKAKSDPLNPSSILFRGVLGVTEQQLAAMTPEQRMVAAGKIQTESGTRLALGKGGFQAKEALRRSSEPDPLALSIGENNALANRWTDVKRAGDYAIKVAGVMAEGVDDLRYHWGEKRWERDARRKAADDEATQKRAAIQAGADKAIREQKGAGLMPSLYTPEETYEAEKAAHADAIYAEDYDPEKNKRLKRERDMLKYRKHTMGGLEFTSDEIIEMG